MFAIIQSGGRQIRVSPGAEVIVDRLPIEAGEQVSIDQVLMVGTDDGAVMTGAPFVTNARVVAVIAGETRGEKIRIFKKTRRKGFRKSGGHRSTYTKVQIKDILV